MSRSETVRLEMRDAVRKIGKEEHLRRWGFEGSAKDENREAAKALSLAISVIERLRWRKIKRIPADIADVVRERVAKEQAIQEAKARHEIETLSTRLQSIETWCATVDPDFYGGETIPALQSLRSNGLVAGPGPSSKTEGGEG